MTEPTELHTERLHLRPHSITDVDDVYACAKDETWRRCRPSRTVVLGAIPPPRVLSNGTIVPPLLSVAKRRMNGYSDNSELLALSAGRKLKT